MGGGRRYHYPKWVWSPAGGWWASPANWKRNTAIYFGVSAVIISAGWLYSEQNTKIYKRKYVIREPDESELKGQHIE